MTKHVTILQIIVCIASITAGCGKDESANTASELERAFQAKTQVNPAEGAQDQAPKVQQAVSQAVSEMKANAHAEAYATLRVIQTSPNLTADQMIAINKAKLAVEHDVAAKAAAGDPAALKAVEAMKGMGH